MRSTDIRIGNLVKFGNHICKVYEINNSNFYVRNEQVDESLKSTWAKIEPIPLTEDILLKCGFRTKNDRNEYYIVVDKPSKSNGLFICYDIEDKSCSIGQLRHFSHQFGDYHFLHQLQNLYFALTNTELQWNGSL